MRMGYTIHQRTTAGYESHGFKRYYICHKRVVVSGTGFDTRSQARNAIRAIVEEEQGIIAEEAQAEAA